MSKKKNNPQTLAPTTGRIGAAQRGQRFLKAANKLFLEKGYADTSLNDVIKLAGGSKATIIELFKNKAGLFAAVIETSAVSLAEHLTTASAEDKPQQTLQNFGEIILRFYLTPAALLAYRGVISEGSKYPDMAKAFYQRGHEHIVAPIAERLRVWHARGLIAAVDFHSEADRFTHMLRNGLYEQHLLGLRQRATAADIKKQVAGAVHVLLAGLTTHQS